MRKFTSLFWRSLPRGLPFADDNPEVVTRDLVSKSSGGMTIRDDGAHKLTERVKGASPQIALGTARRQAGSRCIMALVRSHCPLIDLAHVAATASHPACILMQR